MTAGFESDAIIQAVASPDLHWQDVPKLFSKMCREVGLSEDIASEVEGVKQEVMIEEYRQGYRQAAELMHRFDDLRQRIGFPEPLEMRLCEDNDDGTNDSGYYGIKSRMHGPELENLAREYLERAAIRR